MQQLELNFLTFPLWWYTVGFRIALSWTKKRFAMSLHKSGILLFASHMSEPLYGDYTRAGIVLGYIIRIILLVFKATFFAVKTFFLFLLFAFYLLLLPAVLIMIIFQVLPLVLPS